MQFYGRLFVCKNVLCGVKYPISSLSIYTLPLFIFFFEKPHNKNNKIMSEFSLKYFLVSLADCIGYLPLFGTVVREDNFIPVFWS